MTKEEFFKGRAVPESRAGRRSSLVRETSQKSIKVMQRLKRDGEDRARGRTGFLRKKGIKRKEEREEERFKRK